MNRDQATAHQIAQVEQDLAQARAEIQKGNHLASRDQLRQARHELYRILLKLEEQIEWPQRFSQQSRSLPTNG